MHPADSAGLHHYCRYASLEAVAKSIQVRNVSADLHAELVRRSKLYGKSLTAYVQGILEREVTAPPSSPGVDRTMRRGLMPRERPRPVPIREERDEVARKWERLWRTAETRRAVAR